MLKKILGALLIVIIVLVGVAYMLPRDAHVERSIVIDRPAAAVFPLLNSLKRFSEWSPWSQYDPNVKMSYSGPDSGPGAAMHWAGNSKVGSGDQIITESIPDKRVSTDLNFGDMGASKAAWLLTSDGNSTTVVWTLDANLGNSPVGRYMGLLMDKMVGPDYERGLAQLKTLVEKSPAGGDAAQPASAATTSPNAPTN